MKTLVYNKTILVFLGYKDFFNLEKKDIKDIKSHYLDKYDNCIIYNYFDLKNHKNLIKDKIDKLNFVNNRKIHARNCVINIIDNVEKNKFLNKNHIQGTDKSQIFYGAYHNNELISVMTFDKVKGLHGGLDDNEYDLSRFSVKTGIVVMGIFNKILNKFIKDYCPNKIISYADLNYVNKEYNIYNSTGFKLDKHIPPDFKYYHIDKDRLYHKLTYGRKHRKNLTLDEIKTLDSKLIKIWNCGKLKYSLYLKNNKIVYGFIYKITNQINNKIYIGQTTRNLNKRIYEYKCALNKDSFYNNHLHNAFNKYGFDNFKFEIIDTAENINELNEKEIDYINKYNSTDKNIGYNIELGGKNAIPDDVVRKKMSDSHKGTKQTDVWIKSRIAPKGSEEAKKYGRIKTEEEKRLLSENSPKFWLGKSRSEETKEKIKKSKLENGLSEKQKDIICKRVIAYSPINDKIINVHESSIDASKHYNISQSTISRRCTGKSKNKGHVYFKYA